MSKCCYGQVKIEWIKKNLKNIFSLGCPKKNIQNTKMQFKKKGSSQIDKIGAEVEENFMGDNLGKKKNSGFS